MSRTEFFLYINEIVGTVAFALSGAMTAIDRRLDLFGVTFLGAVTALGGGVIRDILLGQFPAHMFQSYEFLLLSVVTSLAVFSVAYIKRNIYLHHQVTIDNINNFFDAVGLATFTVVGMQIAIDAGYEKNPVFCIFLGMTTGIGGGMLRDMMSRAVPQVLRKRIYALASIAGGCVYVALFAFRIPVSVCSGISMVLIVAIRLLATHYEWSLPRIRFQSTYARKTSPEKDTSDP